MSAVVWHYVTRELEVSEEKVEIGHMNGNGPMTYSQAPRFEIYKGRRFAGWRVRQRGVLEDSIIALPPRGISEKLDRQGPLSPTFRTAAGAKAFVEHRWSLVLARRPRA